MEPGNELNNEYLGSEADNDVYDVFDQLCTLDSDAPTHIGSEISTQEVVSHQ